MRTPRILCILGKIDLEDNEVSIKLAGFFSSIDQQTRTFRKIKRRPIDRSLEGGRKGGFFKEPRIYRNFNKIISMKYFKVFLTEGGC